MWMTRKFSCSYDTIGDVIWVPRRWRRLSEVVWGKYWLEGEGSHSVISPLSASATAWEPQINYTTFLGIQLVPAQHLRYLRLKLTIFGLKCAPSWIQIFSLISSVSCHHHLGAPDWVFSFAIPTRAPPCHPHMLHIQQRKDLSLYHFISRCLVFDEFLPQEDAAAACRPHLIRSVWYDLQLLPAEHPRPLHGSSVTAARLQKVQKWEIFSLFSRQAQKVFFVSERQVRKVRNFFLGLTFGIFCPNLTSGILYQSKSRSEKFSHFSHFSHFVLYGGERGYFRSISL